MTWVHDEDGGGDDGDDGDDGGGGDHADGDGGDSDGDDGDGGERIGAYQGSPNIMLWCPSQDYLDAAPNQGWNRFDFPTIFIDIHMYQNISKGGSSLELRGVLSV